MVVGKYLFFRISPFEISTFILISSLLEYRFICWKLFLHRILKIFSHYNPASKAAEFLDPWAVVYFSSSKYTSSSFCSWDSEDSWLWASVSLITFLSSSSCPLIMTIIKLTLFLDHFFPFFSPHSFFNAYRSDVGHLRLLQYFLVFSVLLILLFLIIILFLGRIPWLYVLVLLLIKNFFHGYF